MKLRSITSFPHFKKLLLGFFVFAFCFSLSTVVAQLASAACDKDATCRDRNGNDPGDARFCRNPGNNGECEECLNGNDSHCQNGYKCSGGKCIAPTPTPAPPPTYQTSCQADLVQIMLVVDTSNSMKGQIAALKTTATTITDIIASGNPNNAIGMAVFDWNTDEVATTWATSKSLYGNYDSMYAAISNLKVDKDQPMGSCMECSLIDAQEYIVEGAQYYYDTSVNPPKPLKRIIIILSDGQINRWVDSSGNRISGGDTTGGDNNDDYRRGRQEAYDRAASLHVNQGVQFWTISYGNKEPGIALMKNIANNFGVGGYYHSPNLGNLNTIITEIANRVAGGTISGNVFYDADNSHTRTATDSPYSGGYVGLYTTGGILKNVSYADSAGNYKITGGICGSYVIKPTYLSSNTVVTYPTGGQYTVTIPVTGGTSSNNNFGLYNPPITSGSIQGTVFNDANQDGIRAGTAETAYSGPVTFSRSPSGSTYTSSNGSYSFTNVPLGTNMLTLNVPQYYKATRSSSYNVSLYSWGGCNFSPYYFGPTCNNAALSNFNFGITDALPWIQTIGSSVRDDENGFSNPIPPASTNLCEAFMVKAVSVPLAPGVVYSGDNTSYFGRGSASSRNWIVSGEDSVYTGAKLKTSYQSMLDTLTQNKKTPLTYTCSTDGCLIDNSIQSEPYLFEGDLELEDVTITDTTTTKKVVLIVNGNLTISKPIKVAAGSFLMIVVKGDIRINPSVGAATRFCAGGTGLDPQIQAILSADGDVEIDESAPCPGVDLQLNIAGSIITNADRNGDGRLINNRSLCDDDRRYPVLTIQPRLDFLLNAPTYMLQNSTSWQEVAP